MTLLFAIWANDGLVAAADGRTSELDGEFTDDTNKVAVVPRQNMVVLLAGRARFPHAGPSDGDTPGKKLTKAEICADLLEGQFGHGSDIRPEDVTVERVAVSVQAHFAQLGREHNAPSFEDANGDRTLGDQPASGIVVGYPIGGTTPEAWRFVGDDSAPPPSRCEGFATYHSCFEPAYERPAQALEPGLLRELGNFEDLDLGPLAGQLCVLLPQIVDDSPNDFVGVGGSWRILTIRPDKSLDTAHIANPCSDPSAHSMP